VTHLRSGVLSEGLTVPVLTHYDPEGGLSLKLGIKHKHKHKLASATSELD
jgi:hypothetical protein